MDNKAATSADASRIWQPDLVERFARHLPINDTACSVRVVNKATAARFRGRKELITVHLSQPVPHHAFVHFCGPSGRMRSLTFKQRELLLCLTAASGSVANLETAAASAGCLLSSKVLAAAVEGGNMDSVRWLLENGCTADLPALKAAARAGHRGMCDFLLSNGVAWSVEAVWEAALGGHTSLMDSLLWHQAGPRLGPNARLHVLGLEDYGDLLICAAEGCSLEVLAGLVHRCQTLRRGFDEDPDRTVLGCLCPDWLNEVAQAMARSPTDDWQDKLAWLDGMPLPPDMEYDKGEAVCAAAAVRPDALARLTWLRDHEYPVGEAAALAAVGAGNKEALAFLLDQGVQPGFYVPGLAAEKGHLEILKMMSERGIQLDPGFIATTAAEHGHLPVVAWIAEEALPELGYRVADMVFLDRSSASGSVELMAWLRAQGSEWSEFQAAEGGAIGAAVRGGASEEALEWLLANGCSMPDDGYPYLTAAQRCDMGTLRCLQRLGCPWGRPTTYDPRRHQPVFTTCFAFGVPLPVLRWLAEAGCPVDWEAAVRAAGQEEHRYGPEVRAWVEEMRQQHAAAQQGQQQ